MIGRDSRTYPAAWVPRLGTLGLVLVVLLLVQTVQPAAGQGPPGPVDQQQTDGTAVLPVPFPGVATGQTFTAGRTGSLDQVDLFLQNLGLPGATGNVVVQIRNAVGNLPGTTILGTGTLAEANIPTVAAAFVSIPLSTPAPVVAGTQYAIVFFLTNPLATSWAIGISPPTDPYPPGQFSTSPAGPGGAFFGIPPNDIAFRTYVTPPATATPTPTSTGTPTQTTSTPTATGTLTPTPTLVPVASANQSPEDNQDKQSPQHKETEEQRQQRQHTNAGHRGDVTIEGNVSAVERAEDGKSLLVTIALTQGETQVVQVPCPDQKCPDIQVGDYLEADGYQNGVGDPNSYFVAADGITVRRNGKKVT